MTRRLLLIRLIVTVTTVLGVNYVAWRWLASVNWHAWWIGVPLVLAETYSLVDSLLFGMTMWRLRERGEPPPPEPDLTVDVLIATYNEPIDLVMRTARAAAAQRLVMAEVVLPLMSRSRIAPWFLCGDQENTDFMLGTAAATSGPARFFGSADA